MVEVTLEEYETRMAAFVGMTRQLEALRKGSPDQFGYEGTGWDVHIEGAAAELAVAKALKRFWPGHVNTYTDPDLGSSVQVRLRSQHRYDLIVRPGDADHQAFVLVTGKIPSFRVHGWIWGRDAKRDEWLQTYGDRPAAFFVPKSELKPL